MLAGQAGGTGRPRGHAGDTPQLLLRRFRGGTGGVVLGLAIFAQLRRPAGPLVCLARGVLGRLGVALGVVDVLQLGASGQLVAGGGQLRQLRGDDLETLRGFCLLSLAPVDLLAYTGEVAAGGLVGRLGAA